MCDDFYNQSTGVNCEIENLLLEQTLIIGNNS